LYAGRIDGTEGSLGVLILAYSGRADYMAPDLGLHLHMEPCGLVGDRLADNDHGHRNRQRNCQRKCSVHKVPVPEAWGRGHSKAASGADQAGAPPARTPLQSPHFLVAATQADCAFYTTMSGL
jgi:hypothetical protein